MHKWKVVPLSLNQLRDVRKEDVLEDGIFRKCDTYRGGGGYDQFPIICEKRLGERRHHQFVVQLFGCNLDCPYCYVTREGVWGEPIQITTEQLVQAFQRSGQEVFHLMGGAPALQMKHWPELIDELFTKVPAAVFHSDIMLTENVYQKEIIKAISRDRCLYAIDIKGIDDIEWYTNTRKKFNAHLFWRNIDTIMQCNSPEHFYFTFTGCNKQGVESFIERINNFFGPVWTKDYFNIDLIEYNAQPYVDSVPWGGKSE